MTHENSDAENSKYFTSMRETITNKIQAFPSLSSNEQVLLLPCQ